MAESNQGQYLVDGLMYPMFCIEAAPASDTPGNGLLYTFSKEHLREPERLRSRLLPGERDLYGDLCQHIRQLRKDERTMQMKDAEVFKQSTDEILKDVVAWMPRDVLKDALAKIPIEERLRIAGLTPEEIKAYLARLL